MSVEGVVGWPEAITALAAGLTAIGYGLRQIAKAKASSDQQAGQQIEPHQVGDVSRLVARRLEGTEHDLVTLRQDFDRECGRNDERSRQFDDLRSRMEEDLRSFDESIRAIRDSLDDDEPRRRRHSVR